MEGGAAELVRVGVVEGGGWLVGPVPEETVTDEGDGVSLEGIVDEDDIGTDDGVGVVDNGGADVAVDDGGNEEEGAHVTGVVAGVAVFTWEACTCGPCGGMGEPCMA